jgi:hypothetical protein
MICNMAASYNSLVAGDEFHASFALIDMKKINSQVYDRDIKDPKF